MAIKVADLFGLLGIKVDKRSMAKARDELGRFVKGAGGGGGGAGGGGVAGLNKALDSVNGTVRKVAAGVALYFGGRAAGKALFGFNSTVEDTKNQIAGMLALTKKTNLSDELKNADQLYANLQKRAATLPGTTQEYAQMLGAITRPITDAGMGLKDLEDISINAVVAAKAFGEQWDVAARDIDQALRGQFKSTDPVSGKILGSIGYKGEEGRSKFNALSARMRAEELKRALGQKQIKQLAEAQGKTFSGVLSTLQDSVQQFLGKVGLPLFKALAVAVQDLNKWIDANKESLQAVANTVSGALVVAFDALKTAMGVVVEIIKVFIDNSELGKSLLIALGIVLTAFAVKAAIAWIIALGPIGLIIAGLTAIIWVVRKVVKSIQSGSGPIYQVWKRISDGARMVWNTISFVARSIASAFMNAVNGIRAFFTELWEDIKAGARKAIDYIAGLPGFKQAITLYNKGKDLAGGIRSFAESVGGAASSAAASGAAAVRSVPAASGDSSGAGPVSSVSTGDINIAVHGSANPEQVANMVGDVVEDRLQKLIKHAADDLAVTERTA